MRVTASDGSSRSSPPKSNGAVGRGEGSEEKLLGKSPSNPLRRSIDGSCPKSTCRSSERTMRVAASDGSSRSSPPKSNRASGGGEGPEEKLLGKSPSNPLRRSSDGSCPKSTCRSSERTMRVAASDGSSRSSPPKSNGAVGRGEGSEEKLLGKSPSNPLRRSIDGSCPKSTCRSSERIVRAAASDGSSRSSPPKSNGAVGRGEG